MTVSSVVIKISYTLTDEGVKAHLRAGIPVPTEAARWVAGPCPIEFLDSPLCSLDKNENPYIHLRYLDCVPTWEYLVGRIKEAIESKNEEILKNQGRAEREAIEANERLLRVVDDCLRAINGESGYSLSSPYNDGTILFQVHTPDNKYWCNKEDFDRIAHLSTWERGWKIVQDERDVVREEERVAKEKIKTEARAKTDAMRQWAIAHGSPRLKSMMQFEKEFSWEKLATTEWFEANTPEGFTDEIPPEFQDKRVTPKDRTLPFGDELKDLAYWREQMTKFPGVCTRAELCWNVSTACNGSSLDLTMQAPNGEKLKVFKWYPETFTGTDEAGEDE